MDKHRFPSSPAERVAWQRLLHGEPISETNFLTIAAWVYRLLSPDAREAALFDLLEMTRRARGPLH